ncbi:MAG: aminopeptidase, partial [Oscillospiraceae bacterium]
MQKEKSAGQKLQDELLINRENGGALMSEEKLAKVYNFCDDYKEFLNVAKTEREAVIETINIAKSKGFVEFCEGKKYNAGEKVYVNNRGKAVIFAIIGSEPIEKGVNLMISHIDSPRLDLKARPLYEEGELAYFKTHYYGGIKKYQWTALPLAIHGVVILKDGTKVDICIGEDDNDPVFCITDLLIHLAADQMQKKLGEGVTGEGLNLLIGHMPLEDEEKDAVSANVLKLLNEKYNMTEKDFLTAEIEIIPAGKA